MYPPREQKSRVCIQILRAYAGIRDAETQSPRGCCGHPGICLKCAQGQKSLNGLPRATRCTDRAQTSSNVSPTVELCPPHSTFETKVRTRRDTPEGKKNHNYTYTYSLAKQSLCHELTHSVCLFPWCAKAVIIYIPCVHVP